MSRIGDLIEAQNNLLATSSPAAAAASWRDTGTNKYCIRLLRDNSLAKKCYFNRNFCVFVQLRFCSFLTQDSAPLERFGSTQDQISGASTSSSSCIPCPVAPSHFPATEHFPDSSLFPPCYHSPQSVYPLQHPTLPPLPLYQEDHGYCSYPYQ